MNTIDTTLKFRGAQGVRVLGTPEAPLFVASDVCACLGLNNSSQAVSTLDTDEKGVTITDTHGGPQQVTVVTESGLYSLIFKSRKKEAKEFKRWVTSEVLPTIRRTGSYVMPTAPALMTVPPTTDLPAMFELMAHAIRSNTGLNEMLSSILPRHEFGSISPSSGLPRNRLMRAYYTSRHPHDLATRAFLAQEERQLVMQELLDDLKDSIAGRLGLKAG